MCQSEGSASLGTAWYTRTMARPAGSSVRRAAAVALLSLAGGCAHSRSFRCPAEGGPPWLEIQSDHFVLKTDVAGDAAERVIRELEIMRMAELGAWDGAFDPPARLEVVVVRTRNELRELLGDLFPIVEGYYAPASRPRIVGALFLEELASAPNRWLELEAQEEAEADAVLRHELAHHLTSQVLLRQPRWFSEGMAQYLAAIKLGTWQGRPAAAVGLANKNAWKAKRVPAAALLAGGNREDPYGYYASSWLMVHWLVNRRGADFAAYQRRLARAEEPAAAWEAAFPDLDPADGAAMARLDRELDAYLVSPTNTPLRVMLPAAEPRLRRREIPPPEVHALRADLFLHGLLPPEASRPKAEKEIVASLREDPSGLAVALTLAEVGRREDAIRLGRAATAARPDDWRGWAMLATGAAGRDDLAAERLSALRRAAALLPEEAGALNDVAWGLFQAGAPGEAFPLAARAARLAPANPSVLDTCGAIFAALGRCEDALLAQRRAVDLLDQRAAPEAAREIRDRLDRIEAQCGAAAPAPR